MAKSPPPAGRCLRQHSGTCSQITINVELQRNRWLIGRSPSQEGDLLGNRTPNFRIHSQRPPPLSFPALLFHSLLVCSSDSSPSFLTTQVSACWVLPQMLVFFLLAGRVYLLAKIRRKTDPGALAKKDEVPFQSRAGVGKTLRLLLQGNARRPCNGHRPQPAQTGGQG